MTGFRKMISSRIPSTWDMALRWHGCRLKYIDRVYDTNLKRLNTDVMHTAKQKIKIKEASVIRLCDPKKTSFTDSINLDRLLQDNDKVNYNYWHSIGEWVKWFSVKTPYIKSSAKISYDIQGLRGNALAEDIAKTYKIDIKLSIFILKHLGYGLN